MRKFNGATRRLVETTSHVGDMGWMMKDAIAAGAYNDNAALRRAANGELAEGGGALCTITHIDGSFSRRLGAQLAIGPGDEIVGSMADGCLEAALIHHAAEAAADGTPRFLHFGGAGDPMDLRLPCGSRIAVTVDPSPDAAMLRRAVRALDNRDSAHIAVPLADGGSMIRRYRPELRIVAIGTGPELAAFERLATVHGALVEVVRPFGEGPGCGVSGGLSLGSAPELALDPWSAVVVLFHDHEWERTIIPWAVGSDAFYIGAQGGAPTRDARLGHLATLGLADAAHGRLRGPVGLIERARDPAVLALSVLAEVVAAYEAAAE